MRSHRLDMGYYMVFESFIQKIIWAEFKTLRETVNLSETAPTLRLKTEK